MQKVTVKVKCLDHFKGELPKYETSGASGLDVRACLDQALILEPGQRVAVPTGLSVEIPMGYEIQVRPRSGWALKEGMMVLNTPGTIDSDYRGEIKIILANLGNRPVKIHDQDRIAQLVLCPVVQLHWESVDELSHSDRGEGGFGSTGRG